MIETGRLILRQWHDNDAMAMYDLGRDARVMEYLGPLKTLDDAQALVAGQIVNQSLFGHCFWPIERRADGMLLGYCGLNVVPNGSPLEGEIEIGWLLAPAVWGQGYAREAAEAALRWARAHLEKPRIVGFTVPANRRSWGLMERLGMVRRPEMDFGHPDIPPGDPLHNHIAYSIDRLG